MYMFYLQQLTYRLMECSAFIIYRKCTSNNALSMKEWVGHTGCHGY